MKSKSSREKLYKLKSFLFNYKEDLAQLVEHQTEDLGVPGSSPGVLTFVILVYLTFT